MLPKISIITPSFNQGTFIEQTILSVLNQGYENIEYIIIDGGSSDNTLDIIKKYESKISYWVSEPDSGQADAINKGLQAATGDLFNWLNSDDYLEPGALAALAAEYQLHPDKKVFCGYTHCFHEDTGATSHIYRMGVRKTVAETILQVEMNQPGTFYKMEVVRELGFLNKFLNYVFDGEFWFRFLCRYGLDAVGFTDKLMAHFRLHQLSKTVHEGYFEFYKEYLNIHLFLLKEANLPLSFVRYLESEQYISRYQSGPWKMAHLEREELYRFYADKYKYLLYKDREYSHAREGLKRSFRNKAQGEGRQRFALLLKLLLPDALIDAVREKKRSLS